MRIKVDGRGISRFPGARSGAQNPNMWGDVDASQSFALRAPAAGSGLASEADR